MVKGILCLKCVHYEEEEIEAHYENIYPFGRKWYYAVVAVRCKAQFRALRTLRTKCSYYLSVKQTRFVMGGGNMVNIEDIPSEGEKIELTDLPDNVELIAISESFKEKEGRKAGGLVIKFEVRDGRGFDQKYTKMSGHVLFKALKKLKIKSTDELQKNWYHYTLTPMRMGFPRMIPNKKCVKQ